MSLGTDLQTSLYKRHVMAVDSRSRENYEITTPSQYIIKFPPFQKVKAVRLLTTEMPNTQYVISYKNNKLDFSDGPVGGPYVQYTATLTSGTYTSTALADEINTQMNAALGVPFGAAYTVTYITTTQKMLVTRIGGNEFAFLFKTGPNGSDLLNTNPANVLGFWIGYDTAYAVTHASDDIVNLAGSNYVYLVMKNFPALYTSQRVGDVFAKIIWNMIPRNIVFNSFASNAIIYPEPLAVLGQFEIEFREPDGSLYDFNNVEHSFSVEIYTL